MSAPRTLRIEAGLLDEAPLRALLLLLNRDGEEARIVGGAVRNLLLDEPVHEVDVATTALPEEVMRRARAAGFHPVPTGIDHGTVTVVVQGTPYEVTTLREDVETFGRHANVAFGRDWRRDAERRDFTINGLSLTADGVVHDHVGGLDDIATRTVRFIGDPAERIAEDYLRILRFFRIHATYGHGAPDPAGLHASIAARAGLGRLSRERVRTELLKLMLASRATPTLAGMVEAGLLIDVLGGVAHLASFENMIKAEAATGLPADPVRRLAALAAHVTEDAERLWLRLRLSNVEHARIASMATQWWRIDHHSGEAEMQRLLYRLGPQNYIDRVLLAWSRAAEGAADLSWQERVRLPEQWIIPTFPLKAADFMARGVAAGPALGAAMRAAEEAWIAAGFPADAAALETIVAHTLAD